MPSCGDFPFRPKRAYSTPRSGHWSCPELRRTLPGGAFPTWAVLAYQDTPQTEPALVSLGRAIEARLSL